MGFVIEKRKHCGVSDGSGAVWEIFCARAQRELGMRSTSGEREREGELRREHGGTEGRGHRGFHSFHRGGEWSGELSFAGSKLRRRSLRPAQGPARHCDAPVVLSMISGYRVGCA